MLPSSYLYKVTSGLSSPAQISTLDCLHPKKILAFNSDTGRMELLPVGCGSCVRCQDIIRDEWCSRMCLHSFSYKWCYYVTLTYGSYNLHPFKSHPAKKMWIETAPSYDDHNYKHKMSWTPSLLIHQHLTDFIKRLRKNVSSPISYCACGEYGSSAHGHGYGRPHFHLIVWTDSFLTKKDFVSAWSFDCSKTSDPTVILRWNGRQSPDSRFSFRIGNVEFENLTKSGCLDWNGVSRSHNGYNSAPDCFAYVAKYVGKREKTPSEALRRIDRVYYRLPFSTWIDPMATSDDDPNYGKNPIDFKQYRCININNRDYEKIDKNDFRQIVAPFFVCSRAYAIGKTYLLQNLERISRGSFSLPQFQGKRLAFPSYFARLVSQQKYPVRLRQKSCLSRSLVKGHLPRLYEYFSALLSDPSYYYYVKSLISSSVSPSSLADVPDSKYDLLSDRTKRCNMGYLYDVTLVYPRVGNISYDYSPIDDTFYGYKYNRHTRSYDFVDLVDRVTFCDMVLTYINNRWDTLPDRLYHRECSLKLLQLIEDDPNTRLFQDKYLSTRKEHSRLYRRSKRISGDTL